MRGKGGNSPPMGQAFILNTENTYDYTNAPLGKFEQPCAKSLDEDSFGCAILA